MPWRRRSSYNPTSMRSASPELRLSLRVLALGLALVASAACGGADGPVERLVIPEGASVGAVADTLAAHGIVRWPRLFELYVRLEDADANIKAGTYDLRRGSGWSQALDALVAGRVVTVAVTIPEGWTVRRIAQRLAPIADISTDSATLRLLDPALADSLGAPGPNLEGYLFPNTYRFAQGVPLEAIAAELLEHYRAVWTPERRAALDSIGMSEREIVTLASIVQSEARWEDEMPLISAVFHNRLRRRMRLQADPTVQYALESHQRRLLYRHIDSVADHPYNTYTHSGLPPGPIGAPGTAAIDAALQPAPVPYLYFVAREDGRHEFSRSLREHNQTIQRLRNSSGGTRE
ncbi:MAG: endolytic transglycosylase MltG [Gemmatimonadota bacterium]|nr:MAG: endolytic transglycosylase MltG [Gemmatimonadota bacterium]